MAMSVDVKEVGREYKEVVRRLLEFNGYEFSRFDGTDVDDHGTYGYRYLDHYWTETDRTPLLITVDGQIAGLALVRTDDLGQLLMSEFLVLPKYRRLGVGTTAARAVFAKLPGQWVVQEIPGNDAAVAFWRHAIPSEYTEVIDSSGTTQRFSNSG